MGLMAKSRMVKPEMWTDDKFVSLSPLARLLFVGMWNFACDNGHLDDSALQLKMRVLPADNCDVDILLTELLDSGMVVRREGYLKVVNLSEKQPLDLRYLVFCDHCEGDPERRYSDEDRPGNRRAPKGRPSSTRSAHVEPTKGAQRSGDGGGGGGGGGDKPRKRATATPDIFAITDEMRAKAAEKYPVVNIDLETEQFLDHHRARGSTFKDWSAAWRTWMTNAQKFAERDGRGAKASPQPSIEERRAAGEFWL